MIIKEIKDINVWNDFCFDIPERTFLNSWSWGNFRSDLGNKVWRKGVFENDRLLAVFLASKINATKGSFMLLTHFPLIKERSEKVFELIINDIKEIAQKEKTSFIRVAPAWSNDSWKNSFLAKNGFKKSSSFVFPVRSWELNLEKEENILLSEMRKGTRYLIRKSLKDNDLEIISSGNESDLDHFYDIYSKTAKSQGFDPFSLDYIKKEFRSLSEKKEILLILATYKKKYIAGAMIIFWGNKAFYHHGASLPEYKNIPASYLIQWEAIKEAKKRSCTKYNFWAISPSDDPNHRWAGLTFFKKGFGGNEINYAPAMDLPLSLKYWITYFFEKIKR